MLIKVEYELTEAFILTKKHRHNGAIKIQISDKMVT